MLTRSLTRTRFLRLQVLLSSLPLGYSGSAVYSAAAEDEDDDAARLIEKGIEEDGLTAARKALEEAFGQETFRAGSENLLLYFRVLGLIEDLGTEDFKRFVELTFPTPARAAAGKNLTPLADALDELKSLGLDSFETIVASLGGPEAMAKAAAGSRYPLGVVLKGLHALGADGSRTLVNAFGRVTTCRLLEQCPDNLGTIHTEVMALGAERLDKAAGWISRESIAAAFAADPKSAGVAAERLVGPGHAAFRELIAILGQEAVERAFRKNPAEFRDLLETAQARGLDALKVLVKTLGPEIPAADLEEGRGGLRHFCRNVAAEQAILLEDASSLLNKERLTAIAESDLERMAHLVATLAAHRGDLDAARKLQTVLGQETVLRVIEANLRSTDYVLCDGPEFDLALVKSLTECLDRESVSAVFEAYPADFGVILQEIKAIGPETFSALVAEMERTLPPSHVRIMFREFPNEFVEIAADLDAHGSACLKDLVGLVGADRVIESYRQSSAGVRDLVAEMNRYGGDFCREFVSTLTPAAVHAIFERDAGQLAGVIQAAGDAGLDPFRKTVALLAASLGAGPVTQALSEDPTVLEVALGKPMALYEDTFPLMVAELGQPAVADAFRSSPLDL